MPSNNVSLYTIMTGSSVLPVSIHKGELFFLFGKENELEKSAKGFSDFGGGTEPGESVWDAAMREGSEEMTGFLGDKDALEKLIKTNGGVFKTQLNNYHVHIFFIEFDPNLPKYYNANHHFLWERMDKQLLSRTKLFEKEQVQWFSIPMMEDKIKEFRKFYQEVVLHIISQKQAITAFIINRKKKVHNKTRKRLRSSLSRIAKK